MIGFTQNKSSQDHVDILNLIDYFRAQGLQSDISLPQIVVCGAQSCGKSSVLEAISGINFPIDDELCTRFPTELVLRRQAEQSIKIAIIPSPDCPGPERRPLEQFSYELTAESFSKRFTAIVGDAINIMGIDSAHPFSSNILRVEISGPEQQPLTLVDLPGLYSSANTSQSAEGMELVRGINEEYMKNPRSIILAVVMASNEVVNQEVTQLARKYDPNGSRTMGLITKPDLLISDSPSQKRFIKLAKNEEIRLERGWHVLRNRHWDVVDNSLDTRNALEKQLFLQKPWSDLDPSMRGIESLLTRLNQTLKDQAISQIPGMERDIKNNLEKVSDHLSRLGTARDTPAARRSYLWSAAKIYERTVKDACCGNYDEVSFFDSAKNFHVTRPLMTIRKAGQEFSNNIKVNNMTYKIVEDEDLPACDNADDTADDAAAGEHKLEVTTKMSQPGSWRKPDTGAPEATASKKAPKNNIVSRSKFIEYVKEISENNLGWELPGQFPPSIIIQLFHEQSRNWGSLTGDLLDKVMRLARAHVAHVLDTIFTAEISGLVMTEIINEKMERIRQAMQAQAKEHLKQHTGIPFTQNEEFKTQVRRLTSLRRRKLIRECVKSYARWRPGSDSQMTPALVPDAIDSIVGAVDEVLMKDACESEAVDYMIVYYEMAAARYVDAIFMGVVTACLLKKLPELYNTETVMELSDEKVEILADDSKENKMQRKMLTERKNGLESALSRLRPLLDRLPVEVANLSTQEPRVMFHQTSASSREAPSKARHKFGDGDSSVLSSNASTTRVALKTARQVPANADINGNGNGNSPAAKHTQQWMGGHFDKSESATADEEESETDEESEEDD